MITIDEFDLSIADHGSENSVVHKQFGRTALLCMPMYHKWYHKYGVCTGERGCSGVVLDEDVLAADGTAQPRVLELPADVTHWRVRPQNRDAVVARVRRAKVERLLVTVSITASCTCARGVRKRVCAHAHLGVEHAARWHRGQTCRHRRLDGPADAMRAVVDQAQVAHGAAAERHVVDNLLVRLSDDVARCTGRHCRCVDAVLMMRGRASE